jgi:hypothetical protein
MAKIEKIEGIGPAYAKIVEVGVKMKKCCKF